MELPQTAGIFDNHRIGAVAAGRGPDRCDETGVAENLDEVRIWRDILDTAESGGDRIDETDGEISGHQEKTIAEAGGEVFEQVNDTVPFLRAALRIGPELGEISMCILRIAGL
jgi:hypothetical protein